MLRNLGIVSIVVFSSHLLAVLQQGAGLSSTTWTCRNKNRVAIHVSEDGNTCHCLDVPRFEPANFGIGYEYTDGIGAYKFHKEGKTWNEARQICRKEKAQLAVIDSHEELELLNRIFERQYRAIRADRNDLAYLGLHAYYGRGDWATTLGKLVDFIPWNNVSCDSNGHHWGPQPYNNGKQNCAALIRPCKSIDDHDCDKKFAFFCEKSAPCS